MKFITYFSCSVYLCCSPLYNRSSYLLVLRCNVNQFNFLGFNFSWILILIQFASMLCPRSTWKALNFWTSSILMEDSTTSSFSRFWRFPNYKSFNFVLKFQKRPLIIRLLLYEIVQYWITSKINYCVLSSLLISLSHCQGLINSFSTTVKGYTLFASW